MTIRLSEDLREALDRASERTGRKNSDIVRAALRAWLNLPGSGSSRPADRVRGLIGSLDSGIPDLADEHRNYILESLTRGQ